MEDCITCNYNKDPSSVPGGRIKEYEYWILEHINEPIPVKGWLVLKTKRHTEGIDGFNINESQELSEILFNLPKIQKQIFDTEQIYICCFTELVNHLHFHLIPRGKNEIRKGTQILDLMSDVKKNKTLAIDPNLILDSIQELKKRL